MNIASASDCKVVPGVADCVGSNSPLDWLFCILLLIFSLRSMSLLSLPILIAVQDYFFGEQTRINCNENNYLHHFICVSAIR